MLDALERRVDGLSGRCQVLEDENARLRGRNQGNPSRLTQVACLSKRVVL